MHLNLPQFLFGLILLWFPRSWMRLGFTVVKRRGTSGESRRNQEPWLRHETGDPRIDPRREIRKVRNYFDLLRGAAGGLAIMGGPAIAASLTAAEDAPSVVAGQVLALNLLVLFAGTLIQTLRYERSHWSFFAPIFYLAGISISLCTPWGSLFAFMLIWSLNPMLGNAQGFLTTYGLLMCLFGYLLLGFSDHMPLAAFGLCFMPVLLSMLTRKPLMVFSRKIPRGSRG